MDPLLDDAVESAALGPANNAAGRLAGVLVVASVGVHGVMAVLHWPSSHLGATATVLLGLACVPCLPRLWREPHLRDWLVTGTLAVIMLGVHLPMLTGGSTGASHAMTGIGGTWRCSAGVPPAKVEALTASGTSWTVSGQPVHLSGGIGGDGPHRALTLILVLLAAAELGVALVAIIRRTRLQKPAFNPATPT